MKSINEKKILKDLAQQYIEITKKQRNEELRTLWRKHNNLQKVKVPVLCSWLWGSVLGDFLFDDELVCTQPMLRDVERKLRNLIFHETIQDDFIFEPWLTIPAVHKLPIEQPTESFRDFIMEGGLWGDISKLQIKHASLGGVAWIPEPIIKTMDDIDKLKWVHHEVDEIKTSERIDFFNDIFEGIIKINVDRRPIYYYNWSGSDIATCLGMFLGLQNLMLNIYENPELIHALAKFMQNAVLITFDEAEKAGDWYPSESPNTNMGMPYCEGYPDPTPNKGYKMKDLWFFTHGQEFTLISPDQHEEFLLKYQMPIMSRFGLVSYVCCENITNKINMLRKIPNLRRIGITPTADVEKCAEQIQQDYVFSWKPNPSMICCGFDKNAIHKTIKEGLDKSQGCIIDIMLKDISTVQGEPQRLIEWTKIVSDISAKY